MKRKSKIIAAAIALLGFSTAASVTGTVAWFTASNIVNVDGMSIQAEAEEGIVISNSDKATWTTTASAKHDGAGKTFIPASTANLSAWYHGLSDSATNGQSGVVYEDFTITETEGVNTGTTSTQVPSAKNVFLLNKFYIQSAGNYTIATQDIYLKDLVISGGSVSVELNKSLRVGVLHSSTATIFAPVSGATATYNVNGASSVTAVTDTSGTTSEVASSITIPAYTEAGTNALEFKVYVWFEGEDVAHKSANITNTLDTLSLTFKFGNKAHD